MKNLISIKELAPLVRMVTLRKALNKETYHIPFRVIYDYEMIFVLSGELQVIEDREYTLTKNTLHIMPPGVRHRRYLKEGKDCFYYNIHFDYKYDKNNPEIDVFEDYGKYCKIGITEAEILTKLVNRNTPDLDELKNGRIIKIINPLRLLNYFMRLDAVFNKDKERSQIKVASKFLDLIEEVIINVNGSNKEIANNEIIVSNYISMVVSDYNEQIDINKFALKQGISPNYFRTMFKKICRKTPHEYLIEVRLSHAKELLQTKNYTVTEVANMIGYEDVHYFSRLFSNKEGMCPTNFMNNG